LIDPPTLIMIDRNAAAPMSIGPTMLISDLDCSADFVRQRGLLGLAAVSLC
jgi:hypothetical protein